MCVREVCIGCERGFDSLCVRGFIGYQRGFIVCVRV